jgi:hypothetical protein
MRTFELHRDEDVSGNSGPGIVAQGAEFDDGRVAIRWLTSTATTTVYDCMQDAKAIHLHGGKTRVVYTGDPYRRGTLDAAQDYCENCPFGSVGGLESRAALVAPKWITPAEHADYLQGYSEAARRMYGDDWRTCSFGWAPAITIDTEPRGGES